MKESGEIVKIEQRLGIKFSTPDDSSLQELNSKINRLAQGLSSTPYKPLLPERGFLLEPLSVEQQKEIDSVLGEDYAVAAVNLQDRLTDIPIDENGEKMVNLPALFAKNNVPVSLSKLPFHEACGEWAGKQRVFWVRDSVAGKILKAGQALEAIGVILQLEDAFRPIGVQEGLFARRVKMTLQQHPDWIDQWDKVWAEARSKTAVCPFMAGHKSGAAIDITLRTVDGVPLPLGNVYPEGGPKVAVHYPYVTKDQWATRQLFTVTMEIAGLRIYPYENWHASAGDLSAGIAAFSTTNVTPNYKAIYGPIKGFNPETGEIIPYKKEEYFAPFFTKEELLRGIKN